MRITKKQAAADRAAAWRAALAEGRVVRFEGGMRLTSYPTVDAAQVALHETLAAGLDAQIVQVAA